jgi:hypothetical protein
MKTSKLLIVVLVMQSLVLIGQWVQRPGQLALAQVPDPGAQRLQIRDELQSLNAKMDRLISILEAGNLQVRVAKPDER